MEGVTHMGEMLMNIKIISNSVESALESIEKIKENHPNAIIEVVINTVK